MDAVSYVNIFETKGLEYLLVISFMIGFFFFTRLVCRSGPKVAMAELGGAELVEAHSGCAADFDCPYKRTVAQVDEKRKAANAA